MSGRIALEGSGSAVAGGLGADVDRPLSLRRGHPEDHGGAHVTEATTARVRVHERGAVEGVDQEVSARRVVPGVEAATGVGGGIHTYFAERD